MSETPRPGAADLAAMREMEDRVRARLLAMDQDARRLRTQVRVLGLGFGLTLTLLALVIFAPGFVGAAPQGDVVQARAFRLVDAAGQPRGEWGVDDEGSARLSLLDERRRPRLNLTVLQSGFPGLALINDAGQRR